MEVEQNSFGLQHVEARDAAVVVENVGNVQENAVGRVAIALAVLGDLNMFGQKLAAQADDANTLHNQENTNGIFQEISKTLMGKNENNLKNQVMVSPYQKHPVGCIGEIY